MKNIWDSFSGTYRIIGFEHLGGFPSRTAAKLFVKEAGL